MLSHAAELTWKVGFGNSFNPPDSRPAKGGVESFTRGDTAREDLDSANLSQYRTLQVKSAGCCYLLRGGVDQACLPDLR